MATLQADNHVQRIEVGKLVLARAAHTDHQNLKSKRTAFARVHEQLSRAQAKLDQAEATLSSVTEALAEADLTQDDAVEALATTLVGDGQPRANPFRGLGVGSPAEVKRAGYAEEVKIINRLSHSLGRRKLGAASKKALKEALAAARGVTAALTRAAQQQEKVDEARTARDALVLPWVRAFSAYKRAARAAEDDGATGAFKSLFGAEKKAARRSAAGDAPEH